MTKYKIISDDARQICYSYNLTEDEAKKKVEILRSTTGKRYRVLTMDGDDTYW